jgi:hypothetical protein
MGQFGRGGGQDARGGQNRQGGWGGMFGGMSRSGWERRDLAILDRELNLDSDQETIIEVLLSDYLDAYQAEGERLREEMREARPGGEVDEETRQQFADMRNDIREIRERMRDAEGDDQARARISAELQSRIQEIREQARAMRPSEEERNESSLVMTSLMGEWNRLRRQLDAAFRAEMSLILTESQLEMLPDVEIDIRRSRLLPSGRLSGESVDLTLLARQAGVGEELDPVLETIWPEYESELDRALVSRDEHVSEMGVVMMDAFRTQDATLAIEASRTEGRLREAVRDINLRYHQMASALLGEAGVDADAVSAFNWEFRESAFRRIYGPTFAQRSFTAALGLEDVTPETKVMVEEIAAAYEAEIAGLNQLLEIETINSDAARITDRIERFAARFQGEDRDRPRPDERLDELFEQRQGVDDRFRTQLESLLTPDQVAQLPETRQARAARRQAEQQQRREEFMSRFDANGDGELDADERRAIGEAMRQGRGRGGDGGNQDAGGRGGRGGNAGPGGRGGRGGNGGGN